jgi:hypothetical protein
VSSAPANWEILEPNGGVIANIIELNGDIPGSYVFLPTGNWDHTHLSYEDLNMVKRSYPAI